MFNTATKIRQNLAKAIIVGHSDVIQTFTKQLIDSLSKRNLQDDDEIIYNINQAMNLLKYDIKNVLDYRLPIESDSIDAESLKKWFPHLSTSDKIVNDVLQWLDTDRDFIYNSHGMRLLKHRYLLKREPIQYCMLRIAKLFTPKTKNFNNGIASSTTDEGDVDLKLWHIMYDVFSCGFMHTSSILADADRADETIIAGEACRLIVSNTNYDRSFVKQVNEICNVISLGVGVGLSASTVPLKGYNENGKIRTGFTSFAKKLDSCNYLTIYERKPKIAIYIEMHNDTIYEAFELRNPIKNHLENVFVGVMISDYFIECYENDEDWYLFPGDARLDNHTLCDFSGEEYKIMFKRFVHAKLYSSKVSSTKLMNDLVTCISETGSPYVVWSDNVNRFSNHKHLGKIKTLNLCAEITNYANVEHSSSCTLMSVNFAMYKDFPDVLKRIYDYVETLSNFKNVKDINNCEVIDSSDYNGLRSCCMEFNHVEMSKYAYAMGFLATWGLNVFMGSKRKHRELGVSPLGVYDMAMLGDVDPIDMIADVSEALYKGSIDSSCKFSQIYDVRCAFYENSPFNSGITQWILRDEMSIVSTDWNKTRWLMTRGMANSLLTAQAPTATTSMLIGVAESVTFPMSFVMSRESENGRNDLICYGLLCRILNISFNNNNDDYENIKTIDNSLERQLLMYQRSAPFIDQSQSTMFSMELTRQNILNLIMNTYYARLKTSIYYTQPKQINNTLRIVNNTSLATKEYYKKMSKRKRKLSCDACSA